MIIWDYYDQLHAKKLNNLEEMYKFQETFNLPRLNHEKIENLNRQLVVRRWINNRKTLNKVQDNMSSPVNSTKHLKKK